MTTYAIPTRPTFTHGLHGCWLNLVKRGVHPEDAVLALDVADALHAAYRAGLLDGVGASCVCELDPETLFDLHRRLK